MSEILSTCPYCGVGCGVAVSIDDSADSSASKKKPLVLASKVHPANFGRLCSKGSALGETLLSVKQSNRITAPSIDGNIVTWDDATDSIAQKIDESIKTHGKESVAFYLSGQLLTEDYYVANKLIKGFIGTANVDTNSRLCMASAVVGYKRAFGSDTVPCSYEDLEYADLIVLIGSNAAWTHPVLYQRMVAAKETNPNLRVVLIDPRKTASDDIADLHLPLAPSSDAFLFQGLLNYLVENDAIDQDYIDQNTDGFEDAVADAGKLSLDDIVEKTCVNKNDLVAFYKLFAKTKKTISFYSQGINQSATGSDKCNAIINCHLASAKIGYVGAGPFSITGQPNAMGGREVGGLANQLAAHMDFAPADVDRVQRFWNSPLIASEAGLKAVDLFDAIDEGKIKVLWVMATNPAVSLPDSNKVRRALEKCETVIVSDITHTDTSKYADIILPALGWSEKDGTVTNSERRISRQREFVKAPGVAKPDWWAMAQVGQKMGYKDAFDYQSPRDVFVEHAQLSSFENDGSRDFDISGLAQLSETQYNDLKPIQWPVNQANPNGTERMFTDGKFFTANKKAKFITNTAQLFDTLETTNTEHKLVLNTGRLRDQWHTMTRTGLAPTLTSHDDVPFVQINPTDAANAELHENMFAELYNQFGSFVARVEITDSVTPKQLFSPIHWTDQFASNGVVSSVVSPEVDPISGQPESKASKVSIRKFDCKSWAKLVTLNPIKNNDWAYWAQSKTKQGYITLVGYNDDLEWRTWLNETIGQTQQKEQALSFTQYVNPIKQTEAFVARGEDTIQALVFACNKVEDLPSFIWLDEAFVNENIKELIQGEVGATDELICSCFRTSRKKMEAAIEAGSKTQEALAVSLGCGSKCGSCRPEINRLLGIKKWRR